MKRIIQTPSFKSLFEKGLSDEKMRTVIDELVDEIIALSDTEHNETLLLSTLRYTRFHSQKLQEEYKLNREGENVSELLFIIDTELELLKMRMQGLFPALPVKPTKILCWTGKATDLVELLYALDTCDCINN